MNAEAGNGSEADHNWRGREVLRPDDLAGKLERCGKILTCCLNKRRGQWKILRILHDRGSMSQKELQECLGIQAGSMSEIAAKMESRGLIVRDPNEADRRKILLSVTESGRTWLNRQDEEHVRNRRAEWFSVLTEEERTELGALLDKLAADWERRFERERQERG